MSDIVWTDEALTQELPRRDMPETHRPHDFEYPPREGLTPFEQMKRELTEKRVCWENGYGKAGSRLAALMRQGLEHFVGGGKDQPEVDSQAVTKVTLTYSCVPAHELMPAYWIESRGVAFALETLIRTSSYCGDGSFQDGGSYYCYEAQRASQHKRPWEVERLHEEAVSRSHNGWTLLRCALARAEGEDYARARHVAETAMSPSTPLPVRCALAFAFPTEPQWAAACARECIAEREPREEYYNWYAGALLASLADADLAVQLAKRLKNVQLTDAVTLSLVRNLGSAAVAPLEIVIGLAVNALTCIATVDAATALTRLVGHKAHRKQVNAYFDRHPDLAVLALAPLAADSHSKLQAKARAALTTVVQAHPDAAKRVTGQLSESAQQVVAGMTGPSADDLAADKDVPPILANPPWLEQKQSKKAKPIAGLETLPHEARMSWEDAEEEQTWRNKRGAEFWDKELAGYSRKDWEAAFADKELAKRLKYDSRYVQAMLCDGPADLVLSRWQRMTDDELKPQKGGIYRVDDFIYGAVGKHGLPMLETLLRLVAFHKNNDPQQALGVLLPFDAAKVAPLMAEAMAGKKTRPLAEEWLRRNPETAALGLIPLAVAPLKKKDKAQTGALAALAFLVAAGFGDRVKGVAQRYDEASNADVTATLDAVVGLDPLAFRPTKLPKLPDFWQPAGWPRPALARTDKLLPDDALNHLGTMLAFSPLDPPYAGIALVKQACTAESLRELAWALFSAWLATGADPKQIWAFHALGHFGDDEVARRLTPLVRAWPGESANARALVGLQILAAIGTDVALMHLSGIAEKVKFKSIKENAGILIKKIAKGLGLTRDQLSDRLVPDLGLEADGSLTLDYGPRSFRVGFDENLAPYVVDDDGKRRKALPKPGKKDDAIATESQKRWKALKKDARAVAKLQVQRLERAMCSRRRWSAKELRMFFIDHPLVVHLSRRLVWGTYREGALSDTFRVAEDRTFTDADDAPWTLPDGADQLGIVHRMELSDNAVRRWGQLLGEYELVQPFPQLGREVYSLSPKQHTDDRVTTFDGARLTAPKLVFGLEKLGWQRYYASDGGAFWGHYREFADLGLVACVEYEGAVGMGYIEEGETLTLREIHFEPPARSGHLPLAQIDPIVISEVLRDLHQLTGGERAY
jgi:hypothetical protein